MDKVRLEKKLKFIREYRTAKNAATGSKFDSNANVTQKNNATLTCELSKPDIIDIRRALTSLYIEDMYGADMATQYIKDIENHIIYQHDETSLMPYCCSISLYPFLLDGLTKLGGSSGAPKHANSYIGGLINLVFMVASQFAGAVAMPEFLTYFDHFLRVDYGDDYINHLDDIVETYSKRKTTLRTKISDWFQQFVYSVNQPAGARNYQSPFTNIAYFDKYYFKSIFKDFVFPDGDEPCWETTKELQKMFMKWFNKERTKDVLTFPVETFNILVEDGKYKDEETADFIAEMWAEGHSFFCYQSDSVDALASCCRLRNAVEDNTFSYTLGAGGIETGSKDVVTININRLVQDWYRENQKAIYPIEEISLSAYVAEITSRVHKYLEGWNAKLIEDKEIGFLPIYDAGFIDLDKQYLTVGINGFVEAAEFLQTVSTCYNGIEIDPKNEAYKKLARDILETIKNVNIADRKEHCKFNTEFVPAENLGVKNYKWDKRDGYVVPKERSCYNSYFYKVEDESCGTITKFFLQGKDFIGCLDGGSAYHCNLDSHLTKKQYRLLMDIAVEAGCSYWTYNIPNTVCNDCGHIDKRMLEECPNCHSKNIDYATRIIGYLKRVSNFSEIRQEEESMRFYDDDVFDSTKDEEEII